MRGSVCATAVACIGVFGLGMALLADRPTQAQDSDAERIAALETQVAEHAEDLLRLQLAVAGATVVGVSGPAPDPPAGEEVRTITGSVTLVNDDARWRERQACYGTGGYDDIREGATVEVMDGPGDVIAVGRLKVGVSTGPTLCAFAFDIAAVPDATIYQIEVANRAAPSYSREDLDRAGWEIHLEIGD